jgi:hypothetical protein
MDKRNLISVTLLVTALAFNPLVAKEVIQTNILVQENRVTSKIASILHKRGLDEDAAKEISENFVNEDEELFALMLDNLLYSCDIVGKDEILEYLSRAALHRQNVHLDSYAQLVSMVSKIKQSVLDKNTLEQLNVVAKSNTYFAQNYKYYKEKQI